MPILAELRAIPGLRKAYFVRKQLKFLTHQPLYVVGFKAKRTLMFRSKPREADVLRAIQHEVHCPGEALIHLPRGRELLAGPQAPIHARVEDSRNGPARRR